MVDKNTYDPRMAVNLFVFDVPFMTELDLPPPFIFAFFGYSKHLLLPSANGKLMRFGLPNQIDVVESSLKSGFDRRIIVDSDFNDLIESTRSIFDINRSIFDIFSIKSTVFD